MSNIFAKYTKELSGVRVISSDKAFMPTKNGRVYPNPDYDIIGKVDVAMPNVILKANRDGHKTAYIEDTSALTKKTKGELVNFFYNKNGKRNNRTKAYLVRTDRKSKTKPHLRKTGKRKSRKLRK